MLEELYIKSFVLIDEVNITFKPGFNVITGETGAGKSILIDALSLALGERASTNLIHPQASQAIVSATFNLPPKHPAWELLREQAIPSQNDNTMVLRRIIVDGGPNRAYINDIPVTLNLLLAVGNLLVDMHGQHQHQSLLQPSVCLELLDKSADNKPLREQFTNLLSQRQQIKQKIKELYLDEKEKARKLDSLTFQLQEIEKAQLDADEEEKLKELRHKLRYAQELTEGGNTLSERLYQGSGDKPAISEELGSLISRLEELVRLDNSLQPYVEELENANIILTEVGRTLAEYVSDIETSPDQLDEVEARLHLLSRLKNKYGSTIPDILGYASRLKAEIESLTETEQEEKKLKKQLIETEQELVKISQELRTKREKIAKELKKHIPKICAELGMEGANFEVVFSRREDDEGLLLSDGKKYHLFNTGLEQVNFYITTNPGQPLRPLAQVASGGEISRIMLALKTIFNEVDPIETLIFDEIDLGIGGHTAKKVGEKLSQLSKKRQVICITHLHQIASCAPYHLTVRKEAVKGENQTRVYTLSEAQRAAELARMLGVSQGAIKNLSQEFNSLSKNQKNWGKN